MECYSLPVRHGDKARYQWYEWCSCAHKLLLIKIVYLAENCIGHLLAVDHGMKLLSLMVPVKWHSQTVDHRIK